MAEIQTTDDALFEKIAHLIEEARQHVKKTVNTAMVYTYYNIGRHIIENEQHHKQRAAYGKKVLQQLSYRLTDRFGKGWSVETLTKCRKFYSAYSISSACQTKSQHEEKSSDRQTNSALDFTLSWNHYQILMRIAKSDERKFYEIEAKRQNWGYKWLQRQVDSCLYERLVLSRDKNDVMRLASEGQTIEKPSDIIKSPITLEFLGLKPDESYSETKLENAIIGKIQNFLLEMGKGFLFEARQKRFTFDEDNYYVDLVFYNRLLQCYVLIDLKIDKLTHQDLGQMQMYVNYFDRYVKQDFEKPTIGILLCKEKNDTLVELTLPKDANIYASAYELYLPNKELLQAKVKEWIEEFEENEELNKQ